MFTSRSKGDFSKALYNMLCRRPHLHQRPYHADKFSTALLLSTVSSLVKLDLLVSVLDPILMGLSGDQLPLEYCSEDGDNKTTNQTGNTQRL